IDISELEAEHRRQSNRQRLRTGCDEIITKVFDGERAALKLATVGHHQLRDLESTDTNLKPVVDLFDQALINLVEAERELNSYRHCIAGDNAETLAQVERQLEQIHDLCRKHRCDARRLPDTLRRLQDDLLAIENRDARAAELALRVTDARALYDCAANALSVARKRAAEPMARSITETLRQLGLPHARFSIEIAAGVESTDGRDEIEFMVTMNPDQAPRPLRKVASGGELSRVSLAVQVATIDIAQVPVLVYDEVDAGIGGRTAGVIARHLRTIAPSRQVLCVTHLAQVASAGANHVVITKRIADGVTHTDAVYLARDERVEEIARMLGGTELTARSRAHAREMLAE
ncbi:MAG: DNA repair protein RecN, partial [Gammaproteobacteria bacterium]